MLQGIVQEHSNDARWGAHASAILNGTMWQPPRAGGHDDKAHPPIHPTRHSAGEADWGPGMSTASSCPLLLNIMLSITLYG